MGVFLSYLLLGLSLAAPIGPINAAQMDKGIKSGFLHSWLIGIGSVTADLLYMMIVYLGVANFLHTPFIKTFLWLFGCFVLLYTGFESLRSVSSLTAATRQHYDSYLKTFLTGFFISLMNPLTILFWLGIFGSVLAKTFSSYDTPHVIVYCGAVILGLLLWDISMATASSIFRKVLTNRFLGIISSLSGISLIGFGLFFGWEAYKLLF